MEIASFIQYTKSGECIAKSSRNSYVRRSLCLLDFQQQSETSDESKNIYDHRQEFLLNSTTFNILVERKGDGFLGFNVEEIIPIVRNTYPFIFEISQLFKPRSILNQLLVQDEISIPLIDMSIYTLVRSSLETLYLPVISCLSFLQNTNHFLCTSVGHTSMNELYFGPTIFTAFSLDDHPCSKNVSWHFLKFRLIHMEYYVTIDPCGHLDHSCVLSPVKKMIV
ncbi:hypothetical protein GEMRC1_011113 [Eukaryota sp. GEM-RC1]